MTRATNKAVELYRRVTYKAYRLTFPAAPWVAPAAVRFLRARLRRDHFVLEWGSGGSTLWFASRAARVLSIESDPRWFESVSKRVRDRGLHNVEVRYCPWSQSQYPPGDFRAGADSDYVRTVHDLPADSCDWVIVDGVWREACTIEALPKVKPGGYLLIDNTNYRPLRDWRVPEGWPMLLRSPYSATETTIWQRPVLGVAPLPDSQALLGSSMR